MKNNLIYILSAALLFSIAFSSCGVSNDVVSNKKIQKRKYQKGYFLAKKSNSNKLESDVAEYESPTNENTKITEDVTNIPAVIPSLTGKSNLVQKAEKKSEKINLKNVIKTIREVNKSEKLASADTKNLKGDKDGLFSKEKFNSKYEATVAAADDFKAPTETDLLKLGITLLILGLVLYIVAVIASVTSGGLGGIFYLLSSLAWLGGVICLVLYFLDKYDI